MLRQTLFKVSSVTSTIRTLKTAPVLSEKSFCKVQLVGRVGADPKLVGAEDRQVVMFNVAVNILHRAPADETPDPETAKEKTVTTHWHSVVVRRPALQNHVLKSIWKGTRVLCNGALSLKVQGSTEGGFTQKIPTIILDEIVHLGYPKESSSEYSEDKKELSENVETPY